MNCCFDIRERDQKKIDMKSSPLSPRLPYLNGSDLGISKHARANSGMHSGHQSFHASGSHRSAPTKNAHEQGFHSLLLALSAGLSDQVSHIWNPTLATIFLPLSFSLSLLTCPSWAHITPNTKRVEIIWSNRNVVKLWITCSYSHSKRVAQQKDCKIVKLSVDARQSYDMRNTFAETTKMTVSWFLIR